jgi:hypothetical protein
MSAIRDITNNKEQASMTYRTRLLLFRDLDVLVHPLAGFQP